MSSGYPRPEQATSFAFNAFWRQSVHRTFRWSLGGASTHRAHLEFTVHLLVPRMSSFLESFAGALLEIQAKLSCWVIEIGPKTPNANGHLTDAFKAFAFACSFFVTTIYTLRDATPRCPHPLVYIPLFSSIYNTFIMSNVIGSSFIGLPSYQ